MERKSPPHQNAEHDAHHHAARDTRPTEEWDYPAKVRPPAAPLEGVAPEDQDNLVLHSGWTDDNIQVAIGPMSEYDKFLDFGGGEVFHLRVGSFEPADITIVRTGSTLSPDPIVFDIPRSRLGPEGEYRSFEMQYSVRYRGGTDTGPIQRISVDNVRPGGDSEPQNLVFTADIVANGILPTSFKKEGDKEYIEATIPATPPPNERPPYLGLKVGDTITGVINGDGRNEEAEIGVVAAGDTGDIVVRFYREFIEKVPDGSYDFQYHVTGRELLRSNLSSPVHLRVALRDYIPDLEAPLVPAYDEDEDKQLVTEQDARTGVQVEVPRHPAFTSDHRVSVLWGAYQTARVPVGSASPIVITLPYSAILNDWKTRPPAGGSDKETSTDVSYSVFKVDQPVGVSPTHTVFVNLHTAGEIDPDPGTEPHDNLIEPVVRPDSGADFDNHIPLRDEYLPASVRISKTGVDGTPMFQVGDIVTVHYGATTTLAPHTVTAGDLEDTTVPLEITLPWSDIKAGGFGTRSVAYWVERTLANGGANTSKSPSQDVRVDTREGTPGGGELELVILPEFEIKDPDPEPVIGRDRLFNGTAIGIPEYSRRGVNDTIEVFAAMYRGQPFRHQDGEPAVAGFGAEPTDADRNNWFTLTDTSVRPPDDGPVDEGGGVLRPPITQRHILFQMPGNRFPSIEEGDRGSYHMHIRYRITNDIGPTVSEPFLVSVDARGDVQRPMARSSGPATLTSVLRDFDTLTRRLRELEKALKRWLGVS